MVDEKIRNVAIIAHVDHGKTTLVDEMLKQSGIYRENQEVVERVMDSGDLERERGITILAKNTAITYGDTKINIVDTPGHADFGGEVERILKMVNGVILLVDAAEGPMPQTRFVLSKALELGHRVIVVVNKIDRPDQRVLEVVDEVLELLIDLDATDDQLDSPMLFCSGRQGTASYSPDVAGTDLKPLFDTILDYIPAPEADVDQPFQMLVSSIDYSEFVGRIAIGRIERGVIHQNDEIVVCNYHDPDAVSKKLKAVSMYEFDGLSRVPVTTATAGNIIALSGIGDITIGDTICAPTAVEPLDFVKISAPTMEMTFYHQRFSLCRPGRKICHLPTDPGPAPEGAAQGCIPPGHRRPKAPPTPSMWRAGARCICPSSSRPCAGKAMNSRSRPQGAVPGDRRRSSCEPMEQLVCDVPSDCVGAVIEKMGNRKGDLLEMTPVGTTRMKLDLPGPCSWSVRLSERVPDRHQGRRHYGLHLRFLPALQG